MFTKTTYHDLIKLVENELDLPHMGAYTGHYNILTIQTKFNIIL